MDPAQKTIQMKVPTQCQLWLRTDLTPFDLNMEMVKVFTRTSHIERDLLKCRECGQLYFHDWYEHVNFNNDAAMYDTYIPVETEKEIDELSNIERSADLAQYVPQLHGSFTNDRDDHLKWVTEKYA